MSGYEEIKKSLSVMDYLEQKAKSDKRDRSREAELQEARHRIKALEGKLRERDSTITRLTEEAEATEQTIHQRALVIAEGHVAVRLPAAVEEALKKEIEAYPFECSESIRRILSQGIQALYQESFSKSWWAPLLLGPAAKSPNQQVDATLKKIYAKPTGKATIIGVIKKPK